MTVSRERAAAHRSALDHVLTLISAMPWCDSLVLRGSMLMCAWAGDTARDPVDLDFVVLPELSIPVDSLDPHPHVAGFDVVRQWPEVADGAGDYELWKDGDDEFDTCGVRVCVPPDGLSWETEAGRAESVIGFGAELAEAIRAHPRTESNVVLDPDGLRVDGTWSYSYSASYSYGADGPGGVRVVIPWSAPEEGCCGVAQVDFALDERLPEAPVWALIPRGPASDASPLLVRSVSPGLALAWKLLWLRTDSADDDGPAAKDLYDAVILAENHVPRLSAKLLRRVLGPRDRSDYSAPDFPALDFSAPSEARWSAFLADKPGVDGTARDWTDRLRAALACAHQALDEDSPGPETGPVPARRP